MGYEKNMSFFVITEFLKVWKKVEKLGLGCFKRIKFLTYSYLQVTNAKELNKGNIIPLDFL